MFAARRIFTKNMLLKQMVTPKTMRMALPLFAIEQRVAMLNPCMNFRMFSTEEARTYTPIDSRVPRFMKDRLRLSEMPAATTEEELRALLEQHGAIRQLALFPNEDRSSQSCICYVIFEQ